MLATLHIAPLRPSVPKPKPSPGKRLREEKPPAKDIPSAPVRQSKRLRGLGPTGAKLESEQQFQDEEPEYVSPRKRQEHPTEESYANRMERYLSSNEINEKQLGQR